VCDSTRAHTVIAVPRIAATAGHLLCRGQVSCGSRSRRCVPQQSAVFAGGLARRHSLSQRGCAALSSGLACRRQLEQRSCLLQRLPVTSCAAARSRASCAAAAALARWSLPTKSLQPLPLATCQALPPVAVLLSLSFRTRRLEPESHIIMTSSSARARQTRITRNNN